MTKRGIVIRWTETAKSQLAKLPLKVRRGLLEKAAQELGINPDKRDPMTT